MIFFVVEAPHRRLRNYVHISILPPETMKHPLGSRIQINCEIMGSPAPSVQWLRNEEPLIEYEEETNEIFSPHPSSIARLTSALVLTTPSSNLEDVYTCVASAGLKTMSASTTVYNEQDPEANNIISLRKLLTVPRKPIITTYFNEIMQEMGTNMVLPCRVHSHPKSQLIWQDNDDVVVNFSGNPRMRVLPSGSLLINNLRWAEMGVFTCTAKNLYGKDSITTFIYPLKP